MSRLYVVEPRLTTTGMSADERLPVQARGVRDVAASVVAALASGRPAATADLRRVAAARLPGPHEAWARVVAKDLLEHPGASLVIAGDGQPPEVHALCHAANDLLGNAGRTVTYASSPLVEANQVSHGLQPLLRSIDAGEVAALVIVGGNPVYTASVDLEIARRVASLPLTAYVGLYENGDGPPCAKRVQSRSRTSSRRGATRARSMGPPRSPQPAADAPARRRQDRRAGARGARRRDEHLVTRARRELLEVRSPERFLGASAGARSGVSGSADTATAAGRRLAGRIARELASPSTPQRHR